jgi:hypothetical protein
MLTGIYRDFAALPEAHQQRLRDRDRYFGDVLAAPFGSAGDDHRRLRAVIGHATSFWTCARCASTTARPTPRRSTR